MLQEANMAMGDITRTVIRGTAVDFSFPYFVTRVGYFTKKPYPLPRIESIVWPFDKYLWLCLVVTLPIFTLTYLIWVKLQPRSENVGSQDLVTHVMMIFLYQSKQIMRSEFHKDMKYDSFQICPIGRLFGILK